MRVLYLTHRLPYAPNRGDRIRAYHTLSVLRGHAEVDLVSLVHDGNERAHQDDLRGLTGSVSVAPVPRLRNRIVGAAGLAGSRPLTHSLLDSPAIRPILNRLVATRRPDVVLAYCSGMARFALEPPLAGLPFVLDLVDVDSLKWQALAQTARVPLAWVYRREAWALSRFEARAAQAAFATLTINDREAAALKAIAPNARIEVVGLGVDCEHFRNARPPSTSSDVVFCGVMNYAPNEQGALWLAREVWPLVRRTRPDARLRLVGSNPTSRVRALAAADPTIEVTGEVADVRPSLWNAAVAAAPLLAARGMQNKVLEAIAAGLPTVVTSVVATGLPHDVLSGCRVADSAVAFAGAVLDCLQLAPADRRSIAERVDLSALSWASSLAPLPALLEAAVARDSHAQAAVLSAARERE
jgi:polysaccharide biosynthesis protein PslH